MHQSLGQQRWDILFRRIKNAKCTPFIGAGASASYFKTAPLIAQSWARKHDYPFADSHDLARVAQYMAIKSRDRVAVKEALLDDYFKAPSVALPFDDPYDPYGLLADLPLPLYITTNYDDLLVQALRSRDREPQLSVCPWNASASDEEDDIFKTPQGYRPTPEKPIVYFLHGHKDRPESLVLTEDDYLDFLVTIGSRKDLLPPVIQQAMAKQTLLFIGYGIRDYTFRFSSTLLPQRYLGTIK